MLVWFRVKARSISGAALASLVTMAVWSAAPHPDDCHDAACAAGLHDPSGHSVGRAQDSDEHPIHCVLCHWTRSFRPSAETAQPLRPPAGNEPRASAGDVSTLSPLSATQPPLRAPPALPHLV